MKKVSKLVFMISLAGSMLCADITTPKNSLIGVEGGFGAIDVSASDGSYDKNDPLTHIGLKIGAEGDSYRAFVSGRYYQGDRLDYLNTLEFSIQYILNISSHVNFFLGANIGRLNLKMDDKSGFTRELSDSYIGGDIGANIHLGDSFDLEFGARLTNIDSGNLKNDITYQFDSMVDGYASIIYKYSLD